MEKGLRFGNKKGKENYPTKAKKKNTIFSTVNVIVYSYTENRNTIKDSAKEIYCNSIQPLHIPFWQISQKEKKTLSGKI